MENLGLNQIYAFIITAVLYGFVWSAKDPYTSIRDIEWWKEVMLAEYGAANPMDMREVSEPSTCTIDNKLKFEIESYREIVDRIIRESTQGEFKGKTYKDLEDFVDAFGSRISGSDTLENALSFLHATLFDEGLQNVHEENVTVPKWIRSVRVLMHMANLFYQMHRISMFLT